MCTCTKGQRMLCNTCVTALNAPRDYINNHCTTCELVYTSPVFRGDTCISCRGIKYTPKQWKRIRKHLNKMLKDDVRTW